VKLAPDSIKKSPFTDKSDVSVLVFVVVRKSALMFPFPHMFFVPFNPISTVSSYTSIAFIVPLKVASPDNESCLPELIFNVQAEFNVNVFVTGIHVFV